MIALALLLAQTAPPATAAKTPGERYRACAAVAERDTRAGVEAADLWAGSGGGHLAARCKALALSTGGQWKAAAALFDEAAAAAEQAGEPVAWPTYAQAGNAWLAAADAGRARTALDKAIDANVLTGLQRGQAHADRARALVALNELPRARADLDQAVKDAPEDVYAWLLSATLARRMGDLSRARDDIVEAAEREPEEPAILLELGNIAAASGEGEGAKRAWQRVVALAPDSFEARAAQGALAQFDAD